MYLKDSLRRKVAATLAVLIIVETLQPVVALALTGGPSQPEVQGFKPIEATNMVDIFSGDFNYNLPLFEVDGYPVNMSYNSNPRMDDEASWVGLGWTLNPGAVNREVRGLPDDFKNEDIVKEFHIKRDLTVGANFGLGFEFLGIPVIKAKQGIFWNNKKGFGTETTISASASLSQANASIALTSNSQTGLDLNPSIGLTKNTSKLKLGINAGANINSRQGLKTVSYGFSIKDAATSKKGYGENFSTEMGGFTYFPTNQMPMSNFSFNFHSAIGTYLFPAYPDILLDGYVSNQKLAITNQTQKGYGYLYHNEGQKDRKAVLDCNRDGQLMYREDMPNVPLSYGTYDNFSVAGQGVGGQYRLYRNDVGMLNSGYSSNNSIAASGGFEAGAGNIFHNGFDVSVTKVDNTSEGWIVNNKMRDVTKFTENNKDYEGTYFKETSEKTVGDEAFTTKIGGTDPVFTQLSKDGSTISTERKLEAQANKQHGAVTTLTSNLQKTQRAKRYGVFSYLTAGEKMKVGLDKVDKTYTANTLSYGLNNCVAGTTAARNTAVPNHHINEISVTKSDGARYVFGLPVYNVTQSEVSFSCDSPTDATRADPNLSTDGQAQVNYPLLNGKVNYEKGRDQFYESQAVAPNAHSYLLTGVLSDDYVDVTGDGITDDDSGNGVKFNYTLNNSKYKWRTPFKENSARLMQGMKTDKKDDKASYVYGEKEVWYLHSIESRNMVAQFYTSPRGDGYGVKGENGGVGPSSMAPQRLDLIKIFSKSDLLKNGTNAIPIKTVHFQYKSNALCTGIDNWGGDASAVTSAKGKLTLEKVYFTFGNNGKGQLNAYKFDYKAANTEGSTFTYKPTQVDRWGFYKEHPANYPNYIDYPYTVQDKATADKNTAAWSLNKIILPSGGEIAVEYESDDYAYVQNKRAGQMFFIKGFSNTPTINGISAQLYQPPPALLPFGFGKVNNYLAIDVSNYVTSLKLNRLNPIISANELSKLFLEDVNDIFFKAKVQLTDKTAANERVDEFVTGYASRDKTLDIKYESGILFVPVVNVSESNNNKIHPFTAAALQTVRMNLPDVAYDIRGKADAMDVDVNSFKPVVLVIKSLASLAVSTMDLIKGFNKVRVQQGWCKNVDVASKNAWVRLANPDGYKLGGGSRVKKIAVNDMWSKEGTSNSYVQKFSYTTVKDGKTISSGVASYEPALGGEENAMKQPLPYDEKVKLAPDNSYYTETPIGESFFPSASIGYSEVKVESTDKLEKSVGTGSTVSKFYTAKDFPTITDFTNIVDGTVKVKPSVIAKIFKFNVVDQRAVSQGFSVETNDMHGKPKEEIIYNQNGAAISTTNYYYKTDDPNATTFHLNNKVQVVNTEGVIEPRNMGVETDIWQEMQEENSRTETMGIAYNNEVFTIFGFVFYVPIPLPIYQNQNKGIKMAITTKHIRRMGILDKIVKTVDGSTQSTQNLAYDIETGDVLLTQTQNEYNDPLYNFTYPAHWAYDGMGSAYKNVGNVFKGVTFDNGVVMNMTPNDVKKYFTAGDELILTDQTGLTKEGVFYVAQYPQDPLDNSTGTLRVFYPSGEPVLVGATYTVRIKRSGRRNKSAMPIGSIASLKNPFVNNQLAIISGNGTNGTKVIQSDAKEYHDIWGMRCPKVTTTTCDDDITTFLPYQTINPYVSGTRGNWRSWRGFLHYNDRNVTSSTASSNIRRDGYIPEFAPYWAYNSSSKFWESSANNKWVRSDLIVHYDQRGNEIESKDANDIVSSASFGFNGTQVVAVTANAQHQEMTYDSFEDYDFKNDCKTNTTSGSAMNKNIAFYRGKTRTLLDGTVSHTGKYSMAIEGNAQVRVSGQLDGVFCGVTPNTLTLPAVDIAAAPSIPGTARITAKCEDCLPEFELLRDKRYTMTAWVASQTSLKTNEAPLSIKVSISTQDGSIPVNLRPQGPVIEGWQKLEGQFTTSGSGQVMYFTFTNISTSLKCYVDDVRILPFNAKMKAYAYDQRSRRLMAELDENHYATFYEYDDEGQLVRIKRETETGIQTVKEARNYLKPN